MTDLFPSVDKRIAAWQDLKRRIDSREVEDKRLHTTITLSREFGCEAYPLAKTLKSQLEEITGQAWTIFEEDAVDAISSEPKMSGQLEEDFGERGRYLDSIVATLIPGWKTEAERYTAVARTLFSIARQGHAILVGRGAFAITKDLENCFHIRLIAPESARIAAYAKLHKISESEAEKIVKDRNEARIKFLRSFLGVEFNLYHFHLILNDALATNEQQATTIMHFIEAARRSR